MFIETLFTQPWYYLSLVGIVVVSITLHELCHVVAAWWEGDDTAIRAGRLTLNPWVHLGPTSLILLLVAGVAWGYTPVDRSRFRHAWGDVLVSLAGPAANGLLVLVAASLFAWLLHQGVPREVLLVCYLAALVNAFLLLLNLLPVPPLDGYSVLETSVPGLRQHGAGMRTYGLLVLLVLVFVLDAGSYLMAGAEWLVHRVLLIVGLPTAASPHTL